MKTTKLSLAEQLKQELMERYNLREDQVRLELTIHTTDLEKGREILANFDKSGEYDRIPEGDYLPEGKKCDYVKGEHINQIWVHRRDGFYGTYEGENDDE